MTKIEIFYNLRFSKIFTKIDFLFKVLPKINSFENFDKHRDFYLKIPKVEIYPGIWNRFDIFHKISEKS